MKTVSKGGGDLCVDQGTILYVPRTHHIEPRAKDFLWDALPSGVGAISVENQDTWDAPSSDSKAGAIFGEEEDTLLKWVHLFASPMQLCAMS